MKVCVIRSSSKSRKTWKKDKSFGKIMEIEEVDIDKWRHIKREEFLMERTHSSESGTRREGWMKFQLHYMGSTQTYRVE